MRWPRLIYRSACWCEMLAIESNRCRAGATVRRACVQDGCRAAWGECVPRAAEEAFGANVLTFCSQRPLATQRNALASINHSCLFRRASVHPPLMGAPRGSPEPVAMHNNRRQPAARK